MTWLDDPPPCLQPAYCFASVMVWTEPSLERKMQNLWQVLQREPFWFPQKAQNSFSAAAPLGVLTELSQTPGRLGRDTLSSFPTQIGVFSNNNSKMLPLSYRFICYSLTVKAELAPVLRAATKKCQLFRGKKSASDDLAWGFPDLKNRNDLAPSLRWWLMTCLTYMQHYKGWNNSRPFQQSF